MKKLKFIGYYNDCEDINLFNDHNSNKVVEAYKNGIGSFHKATEDRVIMFGDVNHEASILTKNGKYMVEFPTELDITVYDTEDLFINIYKVIDDDNEYENGICDDCCYFCGNEIELPLELSVYRCPKCGCWMPNCSMCYLKDNNKCNPDNCTLAFEAKRRNELENIMD